MRRIALALSVVIALTACADQLDTPTGPDPAADAPVLAAPDGRGPVADRWIVVFRSDALLPPDVADQLVRQHGGRVTHRYQRVLRGFAAELPAPAVAALRRNPLVAYIEEDQEMAIVGSQPGATWGLDRIDDRAGLD